MATRYWVGGTGTWNTSSTTNWSATSGGAGGASAPTSADDVVFDINSSTGTYNVTCNGAVCASLVSSASAARSPTFGGTTLQIFGNAAFGAANINTTRIDFNPTANANISGGATIGSGVSFYFNTNVTYTFSVGSSGGATYFVNAGTLNATGFAGGNVNLYLQNSAVAVNTAGTNFNTVSVGVGTLTMSGALTCSSMTVEAGATLAKATYTLTCGIRFICNGTVSGTGSGATTVLSGAGTIFSGIAATLTNPQFLSVTNTSTSTKTLSYVTAGATASNTFSVTVGGTVAGTVDIGGAFLDVTINGNTAKTISNQSRTIYGNWNGNVSGLTYTAGTLATTFAATTTGRTAQFAATADFPLIFNGVGGAWTLTWANNSTSVNSDITVTNGSLTFASANTRIKNLISNNSNTRTIVLPGGQTLTISGATPVDFTDSTNLTLTPGAGSLALIGGTQTFQGGGKTFPNVSSSAITLSIYGANTFATFNTTPAPVNKTNGVVTLYADQTVTGDCGFGNSSGSGITNRILFTSDTLGTPRTVTIGNLGAYSYNVDFRDITVSPAQDFSTYRAGDCGGNSGITFRAGRNVFWNLAAGGSWTDTAWALSNGGAVDATYFPLAQDVANIRDTGLTAGNTITLPGTFPALPTITSAARTTAWTLAGSISARIYGSFTLNSQATVTYSGTLTFQKRGGLDQVITTNGVALSSLAGIVVENIGGTVSLGGALTMTSKPLTVTYGSFAQSYNLTCGAVTVASTATAFAGWPSSAISCTNWTFPTTGPTLSLGTNHQLLFTGDFYGGNKSYRTVSPISNGTMTIYDANTFEQIAPAPAFGSTLRFEAGKTQTLTNDFSWGISVGSLVRYLRSTVPGSQFTWSKSSGTIALGSTDIQDSNATGGATFRAYLSDKNVDSGNNTGWIFGALTAAFLMLFGA